MKRTALALYFAVSLAACGQGQVVEAVNTAPRSVPELSVDTLTFTEVDDACVDFYRAAAASVEEEGRYMRRLADRIGQLGHGEPAAILDDLASQWEIGVWEGEEDEVQQSGGWAEAGRLLAEQGASRCTDLAEWWGIEGYEGEPDPDDLLRRQARIWKASRPSEYYLLVVGNSAGGPPTQVHAHIVGRQVTDSAMVEQGSLALDELPRSVEELYALLLEQDHDVARYDLVMAVPEVAAVDDIVLRIFVDPDRYPAPIEVDISVEEGR